MSLKCLWLVDGAVLDESLWPDFDVGLLEGKFHCTPCVYVLSNRRNASSHSKGI
jgi:hypothetical protein